MHRTSASATVSPEPTTPRGRSQQPPHAQPLLRTSTSESRIVRSPATQRVGASPRSDAEITVNRYGTSNEPVRLEEVLGAAVAWKHPRINADASKIDRPIEHPLHEQPTDADTTSGVFDEDLVQFCSNGAVGQRPQQRDRVADHHLSQTSDHHNVVIGVDAVTEDCLDWLGSGRVQKVDHTTAKALEVLSGQPVQPHQLDQVTRSCQPGVRQECLVV